MDIPLNVGRVIPGAPLGVLGYFIASKLQEYVEPERAGTPKGESIGLSRKKYHGALLSLTSLSLRKQAKQIGVSYGVLRKWRTEDAFNRCILQLCEDFFMGPFHTLGGMALFLKIHSNTPIKASLGISDDEATLIRTQRLPGLGDGHLYSENLFVQIAKRWANDAERTTALGGDFDRLLDLVLPLIQLAKIHFRPGVDPSYTTIQQGLVGVLLRLQHVALRPPVDQDKLARARTIGLLIGMAVLHD